LSGDYPAGVEKRQMPVLAVFCRLQGKGCVYFVYWTLNQRLGVSGVILSW
jgi:hypothetical protein